MSRDSLTFFRCSRGSIQVWHVSFIRVTCVCCSMLQYVAVCCSAFMCDMSRSYMWHVCVAVCCSMLQCVAVHSCMTCLVHTCDMTHSYVWRGWWIALVRHQSHEHRTYMKVTRSNTRMKHWYSTCDVTHEHAWHDAHTWNTHTAIRIWETHTGARCKRRCFSPGTAARHSQSARAHTDRNPPKDGEIALRSATNGSIPIFLYWLLVNPPLLRLLSTNILVSYWPYLHFNSKVTKILYRRPLLLDWFRFWETHFTAYLRFVCDQSAISPFLGGSPKIRFFSKKTGLSR